MTNGSAVLANETLRLTVHLHEVRPGGYDAGIELEVIPYKLRFADAPWRLAIDANGESARLLAEARVETAREGEAHLLRLVGYPLFPTLGGLRLEHAFRLSPGGSWLEEQVSLTNEGDEPLVVDLLDIGLCGGLRLGEVWQPLAEGFSVTPIPWGRDQMGNRWVEYSMKSLVRCGAPGGFINVEDDHCWQNPEAGFAEGWAWTDGARGLLVAKFHEEGDGYLEFTRLRPLRRGGDVFACFGGAASTARFGEPVSTIAPGQTATLGTTRHRVFEGDWRRAYTIFREEMAQRGYRMPRNYAPPLTYDTFFELPWQRDLLVGGNNPQYTRERLLGLIPGLKEMGVELLFLDMGWDRWRGSALWDGSRLGEFADLRERFEREGIHLGLHVMKDAQESDCAPEEWYTRDAQGQKVMSHDGDWKFWSVCPLSPWRRTFEERVGALLEAGVRFLMVDFVQFVPCHSPEHDHPVPLTRREHVEEITAVVRRLSENCPETLIELQNPAEPWSYTAPLRLGFGRPDLNMELWGFEYMWKPLEHLLSGQSRFLYYFRLAFDLPLYLQVKLEEEDEHCLALWWTASLVHHLGVGGYDLLGDAARRRFRGALERYRSLRRYFTHGRFEGVDEETHLHVLPGEGVLVAVFNLAPESRTRRVEVDLRPLGLEAVECREPGGAGVRVSDQTLSIECDLEGYSCRMFECGQAARRSGG